MGSAWVKFKLIPQKVHFSGFGYFFHKKNEILRVPLHLWTHDVVHFLLV